MESKLSRNRAKSGYVIEPTFRAAGLVHCFSILSTLCPGSCEASPKGAQRFTLSRPCLQKELDPFTSFRQAHVVFRSRTVCFQMIGKEQNYNSEVEMQSTETLYFTDRMERFSPVDHLSW